MILVHKKSDPGPVISRKYPFYALFSLSIHIKNPLSFHLQKKIITLFKSIFHSSTSILNRVIMIQLIYKFIYNNEVLFKNNFIFFSIIYQKIRAVILKVREKILT